MITVDATIENAIGSTLGKEVEDSGFPSVVVDPHGAKKDMLEGAKEAAKVLFPKESGAAINEFELCLELCSRGSSQQGTCLAKATCAKT